MKIDSLSSARIWFRIRHADQRWAVNRASGGVLLLNHPAVSRAQAGIKQIDENYYLFSLRPANPPHLNGKPVEQNEALAPGDIIAIGPFLLEVDRSDEALILKVALQIGIEVADAQVH